MQSLATKYFYEVALKGSLTAASESLHVAVSAISRQITGLEEEVGAALFIRSARGMVPTEAGQILLRHVRSEEHTSELQSLMRISYAVFCLKKKTPYNNNANTTQH